ncbi:transcriptional regulator [Actinomadura barringtoniae]|uniref:Transcriptional regulator n=1 Tax=Actinomadura barringtoniae TaxID=1427535 RepID=A0A939PK14_9ACTN|nr:transcriptional regulator [Actinomadura barringtoniae]MBO2454181.1 transcriptional regulator [Actinomadura barringtoniae]
MNAPYATGADLLVLHGLRCIGFASLDRVAEAAGLSADDAESELLDLAASGLVTHLRGDFGGWGLTEAGRAADAERIAAELDEAGARAAVAAAFEEFLVLNPELLDLCAAWQLRSADPAYEARVLDRFADFDQRAGIVCAALAAQLLRFGRYRTRLTDALSRARSGALGYLTDEVGSYHTVWFQLHEDLLATLGIPRG